LRGLRKQEPGLLEDIRSPPDSLQIDIYKEFLNIPYMFAESTVTSKNQTTVPKAIVDALGIKPSMKLVFELTEGGQLLVHVKTGRLVELAGFLANHHRKRKSPVSIEEMDRGIRAAAASGYLHSIGASAKVPKRRKQP
jgi:antitoxin PrlF